MKHRSTMHEMCRTATSEASRRRDAGATTPATWLHRHRRLCALSLGLVVAAGPAFADDPLDAPPAASVPSRLALKPEVVAIPVKGGGTFGGDIDMVSQLFMPMGKPPFPVVVFSHGRGDKTSRARLTTPVSSGQVRYWTDSGFAVLAPIRPGYGQTGGADVENSGTKFDPTSGACVSHPDFRHAAAASKKAVDAALAWLRLQSWADATRVILVGQSAGGLATVAAAADSPTGVVGYVNFAGGHGGDPILAPGRSCDPGQLTEVYTEFGKTTTVPSLWIYAQNDQYFGSEMPVAWHAGFAKGGSPTQFVHAAPVADGDGHGLSRHPVALWARYLDPFVQSLGFRPAVRPGSSDRP